MNGTMLTIPVDGPLKFDALTKPPDLEPLQKAVGGWLEAVPHFTSLETPGGTVMCVAMCNEEGKLDRPAPLPFNARATALWRGAMQRAVGFDPSPDYLVGTIVVLYGDRQFMEALR